MATRARELHRKLLERVLLSSDTQSVKDVFRRYDRERAGVLTVEQFRALVRDHDFLETDADLLLRYLSANDQQSVSFHAFMGDIQLGAEQNYPSRNAVSPKKVQQLTQLAETQKKSAPPPAKSKAKGTITKGTKPAVEVIQDPMEAIRTKLRQRVMGHSKSIREVFMEYDVDGSGFLDYVEFGRFMAKYKFALEETQTVIDYLDRDLSGTIDYDEFAAGLLFYRPPIPMPVPIPVAPVPQQVAPPPPKQIDNTQQPTEKPQQTHDQTTKIAKVSNQTDIQQILGSVRSKFDETLKKSKQTIGRSRDLRAEFGNYDVDGDGSLDHQEFGALLVSFGIKLKTHELRALLKEIDPDESERISFQTIANLLGIQGSFHRSGGELSNEKYQNASSNANNEALSVFNKFKRNGSDELDYDAFRSLMHEYGVSDSREIGALFDEIDEDGSGSISYTKFVRVYSHRIKRSSKVDNDIVATFSKHAPAEKGELTYAEFRRVMHESGMKDNDAIDTLIDEIDEDGSGSINLEKFSRVYDRRIKPTTSVKNNIITTLNKFHRDGNAEQNHDEYETMARDYKVSTNEIIDKTDKTKSGSDMARVHDRKIKPALLFTRQKREQPSERNNGQDNNDKLRSMPAVRKTFPVKNDLEAKSRLIALQEQELQFMKMVLRRHNSMENAFREFDQDGQNEMDFEQFRDFMAQYGITDEANISMLLKRLDVNNSRTIDLQEFLSVFNVQRLARHTDASKRIIRGPQQQNVVRNGGGELGFRRNEKPTITNESTKVLNSKIANSTKNAKSTNNVNRINKAARLRQLEEKWIRKALAEYDSLQSAFDAVDQDQDGEITRDEFRKLMHQYEVRDEEDIASLMKKLDVEGNGCVGYEEFASIFHESRVPIRRKSSVPKPVVPVVESKNARGARLRELQIKWMKRVLSCHDSIESAFYQYDKDGDGELDHEEFNNFMKRYGIVKNDDIETLIRRLDTDNSGTISLEEFSVIFNPLRVNPGSTVEGISAMARSTSEEIFDPDELASILEIERELAHKMAHHARDLRLAFRKFDTNGNGLLEYKEFRSVLKSYRLPEMEIRKVIRHLDRDVSGFIDYKEFIAGFGSLKESGGTAGLPPKIPVKRVLPVKAISAKPKPQIRSSPVKLPRRSQTPSIETLKKVMLERILAIHGSVQGAFREYDLDNEGCLNEMQFVKLVVGCEFSRDEAALLLDAFDQEQSGIIEYEDFLAQLVIKGSIE